MERQVQRSRKSNGTGPVSKATMDESIPVNPTQNLTPKQVLKSSKPEKNGVSSDLKTNNSPAVSDKLKSGRNESINGSQVQSPSNGLTGVPAELMEHVNGTSGKSRPTDLTRVSSELSRSTGSAMEKPVRPTGVPSGLERPVPKPQWISTPPPKKPVHPSKSPLNLRSMEEIPFLEEIRVRTEAGELEEEIMEDFQKHKDLGGKNPFWYVRDGVVYHTDRVCVPANSALRMRIIGLGHMFKAKRHAGLVGTLSWTSRRFYWPSLIEDVEEYYRACAACQQQGNQQTSGRSSNEPSSNSGTSPSRADTRS